MDNQINPEEFTLIQDSPNEAVEMRKQIKLYQIVILIAGVAIVVIIVAYMNYRNSFYVKLYIPADVDHLFRWMLTTDSGHVDHLSIQTVDNRLKFK